jgi:AcrR family transcriptional regulator
VYTVHRAMPAKQPSRAARKTFPRGDVRRLLLEAGINLARSGGPDAIVLREATRRVGVAPNAAYRHFANHRALFEAVRLFSLASLARSIEVELAAVPRKKDRAIFARLRLRAVGRGYLKYALEEPGLFRTASTSSEQVEDDPDLRKAGESGLNAFQLLSAALDLLVEAGILPVARRPGAEYLAWSAVHGLAVLTLDGPLSLLPHEELDVLSQRVLGMVENGL